MTRSGSNAKPQNVNDVSHVTSLRKCYLRNMLCFTINPMWSRTCFSLILSVLLVISIWFIGSTGAQPTLKDPNLESKLVVKELSYSNNTVFVDNNKNNWPIVNHDLYGSRSSNQTTIGKDNVDNLEVKWRLLNEYEIQDPPIIIENKGYVQDYAGNVIAIDTRTGNIIWNVNAGGGPTMGLAFDSGTIFAGTASNATVLAINSTDGNILWESELLGDPKVGYSIDAPPIVWRDYIIAGSGGSGLPPGPGLVKGNITALNRTSGQIIWNLETTAGEWVKPGKTPPNGGATAWSGGSLDPDTGILYIPLGSASPNFNASTRETPNLYSNHMVAVNITNGKLIWATPFVANGTVLDMTVPDTHDWDTSWGSSISKVALPNGIEKKVVIGHDKMGNVIAMDAETGQEIWWKTLGEQYRTHVAPSPNGTGMVWSYGVYNYHAVDNDTLYISATNRGLNFFTDGISGHKISAHNSIEQGLVNGTIMALDLRTGEIKWQLQTKYPPRVSPLVTNDILFASYIPFAKNMKTGVILALDKETGDQLWELNVNAPIAPVGPSIGDGMLFVPTGRIQGLAKEGSVQGSVVAFGLP
jgi:alcohol dehydrogenase (cytochrome c)